MFLRNPLRWYNEFWLRHFPLSFTRMTPNAGHEAIASLAQAFPELRVITQNIDALVSTDRVERLRKKDQARPGSRMLNLAILGSASPAAFLGR